MVGLSDFGLASIISAHGEQTASREALTPAFSSPETFRGEEPTALADVYSLAATLYTLLSGRPPRFAADGKPPSFATIMMLHDKPVEDVPGTPPELMALLRAGLSPDPAARPQSAVALRDALASTRGYVPAAAPGYDGRVSTSARHREGGLAAMPTGPAGRAGGVGAAQRRLSPRHVGMAAGLIVIVAAVLVIGVRHEHPGVQRGQVVEDPGDQRLEQRSAQVEAAEQRVERLAASKPPGVPGDVDHAGVAAAGDHHEAPVPDVDDELGDQRVRNMRVRHQRRRPPRAAPGVRSLCRSLIGHQAVRGVIHQGNHHDRIHRLQVDLDGRLHVMPHRGGQAGRAVVHAHGPIVGTGGVAPPAIRPAMRSAAVNIDTCRIHWRC